MGVLVDGWMDLKAVLRIAYSYQKIKRALSFDPSGFFVQVIRLDWGHKSINYSSRVKPNVTNAFTGLFRHYNAHFFFLLEILFQPYVNFITFSPWWGSCMVNKVWILWRIITLFNPSGSYVQSHNYDKTISL